jgi:hypothetical protein
MGKIVGKGLVGINTTVGGESVRLSSGDAMKAKLIDTEPDPVSF